MPLDVLQFLHYAVADKGARIDREGSKHADCVTLEKATPADKGVLLSETVDESYT